jgi:hypothetical protein
LQPDQQNLALRDPRAQIGDKVDKALSLQGLDLPALAGDSLRAGVGAERIAIVRSETVPRACPPATAPEDWLRQGKGGSLLVRPDEARVAPRDARPQQREWSYEPTVGRRLWGSILHLSLMPERAANTQRSAAGKAVWP